MQKERLNNIRSASLTRDLLAKLQAHLSAESLNPKRSLYTNITKHRLVLLRMDNLNLSITEVARSMCLNPRYLSRWIGLYKANPNVFDLEKSKVSPAHIKMIWDLTIAKPKMSRKKKTTELNKHFEVKLSESTVYRAVQALKMEINAHIAGNKKTTTINVPASVKLLKAEDRNTTVIPAPVKLLKAEDRNTTVIPAPAKLLKAEDIKTTVIDVPASVKMPKQKYKLVADIGENDKEALDILVTNQKRFYTFVNEHPEVGIGELDIIFSRAQVKTNVMLDDLRERYAAMASNKYQLSGTDQELDSNTTVIPAPSPSAELVAFHKAINYKMGVYSQHGRWTMDVLQVNQQALETVMRERLVNHNKDVAEFEDKMRYRHTKLAFKMTKSQAALDRKIQSPADNLRDVRNRQASIDQAHLKLVNQEKDGLANLENRIDTVFSLLYTKAQAELHSKVEELARNATIPEQKYQPLDSTGENDQRTLRVLAANQQMSDTHVNNQPERGASFDQLDTEFPPAQAVVDKTTSNLREEDDTFVSAEKYQLVAEIGKNDQRAMVVVTDHQLALDILIKEQRHLVVNIDDLEILVYRAQSTLDQAMYDMHARSKEMNDYFGLDTNIPDSVIILGETPDTKRGIPEPYKLIPTPPVTKESLKKEKTLEHDSATHPDYVVLTTEGIRCRGLFLEYPTGVVAEDIVLGWEGFECQGKFYLYPEQAE